MGSRIVGRPLRLPQEDSASRFRQAERLPSNLVHHVRRYILAFLAILPSVHGEPLELQSHYRMETSPGSGNFEAVQKQLRWEGSETAIVICDMWDRHWCKGATARVAEMAPRMNEVIRAARRRGVFIIHCPSGTMEFYKDTPQRKLAQAAPRVKPKIPLEAWCSLDPKLEAPLPIDDSDNGCDDLPRCNPAGHSKSQIATLEIAPGDAITDSAEAYYLLQQRGIKNVIVMGVHTNMCVLGRPFSIRQMVRQGKNVVLMRDLTDTMYNSRRAPYVNHFAGTDLVVAHIEKYWCPTITSSNFIGGKPFRVRADRRPKVVFVIGENEYRTWETLPEFARAELEWRGIDCRFVHASPKDGEMDFAGYEVIPQADLLFVSVRRRTPAKEMLAMIRRHVADGKPVVGIRTASHAFAATPPDGRYAAWPEFDAEVLGGNYRGHYGNKPPKDPPTLVRTIPAASDHPVLVGVPGATLSVTSHLYRNRGASKHILPLMEGQVKGQTTIEPVAWVNTNQERRVFYTSLGDPHDFQLPAFRRLLLNGTLWALDMPIPPTTHAPKGEAHPVPGRFQKPAKADAFRE